MKSDRNIVFWVAVLQWAKIVIALERAISQEKAKDYLYMYSLPLGGGEDGGEESLGVMVIKSKDKTKAKQRKGALSNWKVSHSVVRTKRSFIVIVMMMMLSLSLYT